MSAGELEAYCQKTKIIQKQDPQTLILEYAVDFLVLPKELEASFYFNFHFPDIRHPNIQQHLLSDRKQQVIFDLPPERQAIYQTYFPDSRLLSLPWCLAEFAMDRSQKAEHYLMYFHQNHLLLFAAKAGKLIFANRFEVASPEAAVYFVLSVQQVFEIGKQGSLCTENEPADDLQALLEPYFDSLDTYLIDRDWALFVPANKPELKL